MHATQDTVRIVLVCQSVSFTQRWLKMTHLEGEGGQFSQRSQHILIFCVSVSEERTMGQLRGRRSRRGGGGGRRIFVVVVVVVVILLGHDDERHFFSEI